MKRYFLTFLSVSFFLTTFSHSFAFAKDPTPTVNLNAISSCLPRIEDARFSPLNQIELEDITYLLVWVESPNNEWATIPELKKDGTCVNYYTQNKRENYELVHSPEEVAFKFKPLIQHKLDQLWEKQYEEMEKRAQELGVSIDRLGWD